MELFTVGYAEGVPYSVLRQNVVVARQWADLSGFSLDGKLGLIRAGVPVDEASYYVSLSDEEILAFCALVTAGKPAPEYMDVDAAESRWSVGDAGSGVAGQQPVD